MLIDTHLHLSLDDLTETEKIINNAKENNVFILVLGGCDKKSNFDNIELSNKYNNIYATLGFHPELSDEITDEDLSILEDQINNNYKIVAIGEIGLDYHYDEYNKLKQQELFEKQLVIAERYNLPVVIHSRDSIMDTYNILKKYKVKGVIHCFSGSLEMANKFIKLGYLLGIGGVLTFKNSNLKEIIKEISLKDMVLETDSPYLCPIRGEKNEPKNIKLIAEFLANIKKITLEEVEVITTENASRIFDLML